MPILDSSVKVQCSFKMLLGDRVFAPRVPDVPQVEQRLGDAPPVLQFVPNRKALFVACLGFVIVTLAVREDALPVQGLPSGGSSALRTGAA